MFESVRKNGSRILAMVTACLLILNSFGMLGSPAIVMANEQAGITVQMYNASREAKTQMPSPQFEIVNTGDSPQNLEEVKVRYYFTADGDKKLSFDCWTSIGKGNLTADFIKMEESVEGADTYLEIGFTNEAGLLEPGKKVTISSWLYKSDWSNFTQTNDYSFNDESSSYEDWDKVTATIDGELVWGTAPESDTEQPPTFPLPENVKVVPTENSISLSWNAVSDATAYDIEVDGNVVSDVTDTAYVHEGLQPDSEHYYKVRAKNENVTGEWSQVIVGKTLVSKDGPPQLKVQMYNVSRGESTQQLSPQIKVMNTGTSLVNLNDVKLRYYFTVDGDKPMSFDCWASVGKENLVTSFKRMNTPGDKADYYLEIGFTSGAGDLEPGKSVDIVSWFNKNDWSSFTQSNDYSFNDSSTESVDWDKMTAYVNGDLNWGEEPGEDTQPAPTLPYPQNLKGVTTENSITLSWDSVNDAMSFDLEVDGLVVADLPTTSYVHENLTPGSQHSYRVKAKNASVTSEWSPILTVATNQQNPDPTTLPAPANLKAEAKVTSIDLTWDLVAGATSYDLEFDGDTIYNLASTSYLHTGLQPETEHTYRVRAKNATVTGEWSQPIKAKTLASVVSGPNKLKVSIKTGTNASTQMPSPSFEITNTSSEPINLHDIQVKYYFTIDGEKPLSIDFWTTVAKQQVNTKFVKMPVPASDADHYLEISFADAAGTLQPGSTVGVYPWFNKNDWSSFDQSNDYSFNNSSSVEDSSKVPAYLAGSLTWGTEPTLFDIPPFPSNITATPSDNSITVAWDSVEGATGYDVEADGVVIENGTKSTYVNQWLNPGTYHTYKVRTREGDAVGIWSSPLTLKTTGEQNLPAPSNVRSEKTDTTITITWNALRELVTGYDIEVDGTVVDVGSKTSYTHSGLLTGSQHTYRVRAKDGSTLGAWSTLVTLNTVFDPTGPFTVNFGVDTSAGRGPISPYIYGSNEDLTGEENFGARRIGGNRMSTYNWENNASNAGTDWMQSSDGFIPWFYGDVSYENYDIPGIGATAFHEKSLATDAYTLMTLQTAGYVAKDRNGPVSENEKAPSSRWAEVKPTKGSPFTLTPDVTDDFVYQDEFINFLVNRFGNASTSTGIKGYAIDNEPGLWNETHPLMHPEKPGSVEVLNKSIELAKAVKNVDPHAEMFGPVSYGFAEYLNMQGSTDWDSVKGNYDWYLDYYLDQMRIESEKEGKRLLDVLDLHWYPEISAGGVRITSSNTNDNIEANKARIQAPRSLWDPSYKEDSWIGTWYSSFLPLIPKLKQSVKTYNKGTKLAFSEYNYGGEGHVSGGIATADVLGIFGKQDVYFASYWKMVNKPSEANYASAAFKIYNNYDGDNSEFGDTRVKAETSDIENSSIYGSVFKDSDNNLHLIVINKNYDHEMNAVFNLAGGTDYQSARVWAFDENSSEITERQAVTDISNNTFTYTIPKLTVCHIVLSE
ncbi:glycoside hydrolase family 44 protein [Brevibacillus sp. SYSU BS000544]|uniref:glycoside hydrolase family 44 protein n=1 Tax=Brevibacillus sp. SYSU BS000544 TaxID=3416443 RepID=UPI003CE49744